MANHIDKMKVERNDLKQKCNDLCNFVYLSDEFKTLDDLEQVSIIQQLGFMKAYLEVLDARLWSAHNPTTQK